MEQGHDGPGHDRLGTLAAPARPVPALPSVAPDLVSVNLDEDTRLSFK
jgi:hypothetical protein